MIKHLTERQHDLRNQIKASKERLVEAQQIANRLATGIVQLEARYDEIESLITSFQGHDNGTDPEAAAKDEAKAAI